MAEEVVMRDLPAIRTGQRKHHKIADAQPLDPPLPGEHVTGRAQLTDHVYTRSVHLRAGERVTPPFDRQHRERMAVSPCGGQPEVMGSAAQHCEMAAVGAFEVDD